MPKDSILARYIHTGVALLLMGGVPLIFIFSSLNLQGGADIFPLLMSGVMLLCGVMSFYCKFRRREPLANQSPPALSFPRLLLLSTILFCFIPLAEYVGFYAISFVYIAAGFLFLSGKPSKKNFALALALAAIFVTAERLIFYDLLTILTPTGVLF